MNLDMLFRPPTGFRLGIEFDGAYWHEGREYADFRKTTRLLDSCFVDEVLRIRERPLPPTRHMDLAIPRAAPGHEIVGHTLAHLCHTVADHFGPETEERLDEQMKLLTRPPDPNRSFCDGCRDVIMWAERSRTVRLGPPY